MNWKKSLGAVSFLVGIVLILNAGSGITGFVIAEGVGVGVSFFIGLVFLIGGLGLMISRGEYNPENDSLKGIGGEYSEGGINRRPLTKAEKLIEEMKKKYGKGGGAVSRGQLQLERPRPDESKKGGPDDRPKEAQRLERIR